jgi:hypothetical protein
MQILVFGLVDLRTSGPSDWWTFGLVGGHLRAGRVKSRIPVRIRVRIDLPHPHACCKRRLNGAILRMRPGNPRSRVTAGVAR